MSTTTLVLLWMYGIFGAALTLLWWFGTPTDTTGHLDVKKFLVGLLFGVFWPLVVLFALLRRD